MYVIPCVGALASVLLGVVLWFVTHPQPALQWGGHAYTSKHEFARYLESVGASYEVWLARHPGAAPWEPAAARPAPSAAETGAEPQPPARAEAPRTDDA